MADPKPTLTLAPLNQDQAMILYTVLVLGDLMLTNKGALTALHEVLEQRGDQQNHRIFHETLRQLARLDDQLEPTLNELFSKISVFIDPAITAERERQDQERAGKNRAQLN
jgi:hypothetical protein